MRVIAGKHKGRKLKAVTGTMTRPTGDKLKEAMFHRMGPFFDGGKGLDLFAGSGALGIEAVSRGMDNVIFVDKSNQAIRTIHQNIEMLHLESQCTVYRNDAFRAIQKLGKQKEKFDLILLDPPYDRMDYGKLLSEIKKADIANHGCLFYLEHRPQEEIPFGSLEAITEKTYNQTTKITLLQKH